MATCDWKVRGSYLRISMDSNPEKDSKGCVKSPLQSKTILFNTGMGLIVAAAWPFLPKEWRDDPMIMQSIIAWITIGNIVLRFLTETAVKWRRK